MKDLFTKAFAIWNSEFRDNPEKFMSQDEMDAMEILPLAEQQALCFMRFIDKVSGGAL